eukprot:CAMPEP_0171254416 /NCGR_PEP_ID=MMETSP0790-20130122/52219_1 /TAXON_ID=2925 /ORGANISM="Alexandrium catenella, Strain OF101" /LENGTH=37 /DNA_ID= /DNA_START= /DNA_END= /DNA_ORIENTATION=
MGAAAATSANTTARAATALLGACAIVRCISWKPLSKL